MLIDIAFLLEIVAFMLAFVFLSEGKRRAFVICFIVGVLIPVLVVIFS